MNNNEDDICYYDPSFYPTEETALEYFRNSPFYDKTCNNEILHMQIQYTNNKIEIKEKLREMVGMEYSFRENLNYIFIIQKGYRSDCNACTVIDLYYILNGIIFKAPTDKSVFISRFVNFTYFINKALEIFDKKIEIFNENELQENDEDLNEILKILSDFKLRE